MINNSPFDDHIKKQFGDYNPEVPPHIWENIMANKEKKRPVGLLLKLKRYRFTILLSLLISTVAATLLVQHNFNNKVIINSKNELVSLDKLEKEGANDGSKENSNNNEKIEANIIEASINTSTTENPVSSSSVLNKTDNGNINAAKNKNELSTAPTETVIKERNIDNSNPKKSIRSQNAVQNTSTIIDENSSIDLSKTKNSKRVNKEMNVAALSKFKVKNADAEEMLTENADIREKSSSVVINTEASLTNYYLDLNSTPVVKPISFSVKNTNLQALNIPCPGTSKNRNSRYFEIYGGPDYVIRSFSDTANSTYLQKRKESTRVGAGFSLGARYTKVLSNGISFRTGINYSQINETFKFEQGRIAQTVYIIDENGDTTGSYAGISSRYKTSYNKYRTLDIPLVIGYEFGKGRLRTNINAGIIMNVYSWQKGDVLDSANQPVNITTGKSNSAYQFKTNVGLGITAAASFYYKLSGKLHFLAEPYFRYNFSAANKADITLKQKFTTVGLRLGLRIDF